MSDCDGTCGVPDITNGQVTCPIPGTCDQTKCECHVFGALAGEEAEDLGVGPVTHDPTFVYTCECVPKVVVEAKVYPSKGE